MGIRRWICVAMLAFAIAASAVCANADVMPENKDKVIYLTFDDGPSVYTPQLLRVLDRYGAKATFFLVDTGYCTDELLRSMVRSGHSIGLHSKSHDFETIYSSEEAFWQDLRAMQELIRQKTGITTRLMRFPGGSSNTVSRRYSKGIMTRLVEAVEEGGFCYVDWNVDSGDAAGCQDTEQIYRNVISGILQNDCPIVLQHDVHGCSVRAVERILIWGREHGYRFCALNEHSPVCHHRLQN